MLKLNASYSKKVPAESHYSSRSYHASIEVELPDGLSTEQLQERIHQTFAMVRESVEVEIKGSRQPQQPRQEQRQPQRNNNGNNRRSSNGDGASPRQLQYLQDLAHDAGFDLNAELRRLNLNRLEDLSRQQCSELIDDIRGGHARAA